MAGQQQSSGIISGINVTPLVDIVLVLLIIFMVTAKIILAPVVPMDLPKASQSQGMQVVFSVVMKQAGPMLVDGKPMISDVDLATEATRALREQPELRAVIHAQGDVAHRRVLHVMDVLRKVGVERIAFGVEPLEGTP